MPSRNGTFGPHLAEVGFGVVPAKRLWVSRWWPPDGCTLAVNEGGGGGADLFGLSRYGPLNRVLL